MAETTGSRESLWAPLPLRIVLGAVFLVHGSGKVFGGLEGTAQFLGRLGFTPPSVWALILALGEFLGGLFVLLGLFTRWAALDIGVIMGVAILRVHLPHGLTGQGGYEFPLSLLGAALALLLLGGGKISLDDLRKKGS